MEKTEENQKKSKNLHKPAFVLKIFRFIFKYIGALFPRLIGRWAYHLWFLTDRSPRHKREQDWLKTASKIEAVDVSHELFDGTPLPVMTYYWENAEAKDAPLIMLVHGWTGRGSQMGAFAEPLLKAGFSVLSFDNHAHDKTPGKKTDIFTQSAVQCAIAEKFGPVFGVVAHSFGGMITPYSLNNGMETQRIVCISPPSRFDFLLERFSETLSLPKSVQHYMTKRFIKEYGENLQERVSASSTSQQLGHIPALIIHDKDDIDVPISEAELLHQAWPNSIMQHTSELGHRRILYNAQVIENTVDFLTVT